MREFHTKPKQPKPPVVFKVDDRVMTFNPPGWAPIVLSNPDTMVDVTRVYLDWMGAGLSDEDGDYLLNRLLDPKDEFDLEDITEVILGVIQDVTGRPTVPPTVSSESPALTDSTDGRPAETSTPEPLTSAGLSI